MTARYIGTTTRGRTVREASLQECVSSLAYIANKTPADVVTAASELARGTWYLFATQAELDADLERGPITADSPSWFAVIYSEELLP